MPSPEATVTVLAPAFNEESVIEAFVESVTASIPASWELLIVDDGSSDQTPRILENMLSRQPQMRVVTHDVNRGMGAALRTGFAEASGDIIITMDADLSHPMELLPDLAGMPEDIDAVYASRYVHGGGMEAVPLHRRLISRTANLLLRLILKVAVHDITTGYRAVRTEVLRSLDLQAHSFDIQLEMTVKLARSGARLAEIPLVLGNRAGGVSKMRYLRLIRIYSKTTWRLVRDPRRRSSKHPA